MLNVVTETTGRILLERELRGARAKAERAEARLSEVFTQAPAFLAVLRGPQHVFEFVNSSYYRLTGHRELVGLPLMDALPEIRGQGFDELLDDVLTTGEPYVGREVPVTIQRTQEGEPEQRFLDFVYYPITEADGTRTGVVAHGSDVTEHVLSRREAQRARQEAEEASRAKSQFLANMSHEIRTPINAIIGYTDLLELGISGPLTDEQRDQLERVRLSSRHLLTIVEDILDVAKVEAGRLQVEHDRVQIGSTVGAAVALVAPQAAGRDIDIIDGCDDTTTYVGDEDRVRQILVNLLSNAVKFTASGGTVHLSCGADRTDESPRHIDHGASMVYVRVADTGIGIPEHEAHKVFRPFSQVESGHTRTRGGTGLGLTISRHLARLMGGDITFESEFGKGSTFTVWLPSDTTSLDSEIVDDARDSQPAHLAAIGHALRDRLPEIMTRYRERLRRDPLIMVAPDLGDADLEDHASTFLTDIAQSLVVLETSRVVPERLLQDGSDIQRLVAELHGRQRAQLGWNSEALQREWAIMWEEIEACVHGEIRSGAELGGALDLLKRFLDRAERISLRSRAATMQAISNEPLDPQLAASMPDRARLSTGNGDNG
jgi:PAS domain S-box-containing protein